MLGSISSVMLKLRRALQIILDRQDELARDVTYQMGRPINYTNKEITTAVLRGEYMLKVSDQALADTTGEKENGFLRYIKKVPLGPILIIFPWNYPYLTLVNSLIPALLTGNSVILKPSPQTPTVAESIHTIFEEAGLPENVIQYFHTGDYAKTAEIIKSPEIKLVCFTGSVEAGINVQQTASGRVDCRVGLELGGNDPAYVRPDVDINWAADEIIDGAVFNSGQSCCAIERVYVHKEIHDDFVKACQKILQNYKLGDPSDKNSNVGPVISKAAMEKITKQVEDAIKGGATDATPANQTFDNPPSDGNYIKPTLLTHCRADMPIMQQETFGPIIPIQAVASDEEAVQFMNNSTLGLTASIWTKDTDKGHELADQVEAGTVFVNRADYPSPDLAWTGWKDSGKGQTLSVFGFEQFVRLKSFHIKEYPVK